MTTEVPPAVATSLWLGGDKRGQILPLDNPFREILAAVGEEVADGEVLPERFTSGPPRPLMMQYDFVVLWRSRSDIEGRYLPWPDLCTTT